MTQVKIITPPDEKPGIFVLLPQPLHDTKAIQDALPALRRELTKRWPIEKVELSYERLGQQYPSDINLLYCLTFSHLVVDGLMLTLFSESARGIARHTIKEIVSYIFEWLKDLKRKNANKRKPREKRASKARRRR